MDNYFNGCEDLPSEKQFPRTSSTSFTTINYQQKRLQQYRSWECLYKLLLYMYG